MTFFPDRIVSDLVVVSAGGCLKRDYIEDTVRAVCKGIAAGKTSGVSTAAILKANLLFASPCLVYKDGTTRPLKDIFPRDYYPVFLVQGETDLRSGDIAELFAANPGEFEVTGPNGERIRAATIDSLSFTPANITTAEPPAVSFETNFSASDEVEFISVEQPATNSMRAQLAAALARGSERVKRKD